MAVTATNLATAQTSNESTLTFQNVTRKFVLYRPEGQSGPLPLVIALHGLNQTVDELRASWTMDGVASREKFAVVYPLALSGRWGYSERRPVKLSDYHTLVDDVGFLGQVVGKLVAERVADPLRVYVAGVSNGGLMAWTLACEAPERFTAIAPLITGMVDHQIEHCQPKRLVPLMVIAGTDDWMQSYDGGMGKGFRLLSIPETLEFWRQKRGCMGRSRQVLRRRGAKSFDPTRAVLIEWTECTDPARLRFYRIEGGGHSLPTFMPPTSEQEKARHGGRSQAIQTAESLWRFFKAVSP